MIVIQQQLKTSAKVISINWDSYIDGSDSHPYKHLMINLKNCNDDKTRHYIDPIEELLMKKIIEFVNVNNTQFELVIKS